MKTLVAIACVCMSLHTLSAFAETPTPTVEEQPAYITSTALAIQRTGNADVPAIEPSDNPFVVDPDADEYIAIPSVGPEVCEESTGTIEVWVIDTE